jgi:hypothetical protein
VEMQIHLFEKELYSINKENQSAWDQVIKNIKKDRPILEEKK